MDHSFPLVIGWRGAVSSAWLLTLCRLPRERELQAASFEAQLRFCPRHDTDYEAFIIFVLYQVHSHLHRFNVGMTEHLYSTALL